MMNLCCVKIRGGNFTLLCDTLSQLGSAFLTWIRIHESQINADLCKFRSGHFFLTCA
jgi:hypothetical protein